MADEHMDYGESIQRAKEVNRPLRDQSKATVAPNQRLESCLVGQIMQHLAWNLQEHAGSKHPTSTKAVSPSRQFALPNQWDDNLNLEARFRLGDIPTSHTTTVHVNQPLTNCQPQT